MRKKASQRLRDLAEQAALNPDPCTVKIMSFHDARPGAADHNRYIADRRFREDAGDGHLPLIKTAHRREPTAGLTTNNGYRNETAGHRAAENGYEACLSFCVDNGLDVDAETVLGSTPAHYAATGGANGCIKLLSDHLADLMKQNLRRETPIMLAKQLGKENTEELINLLAVEGEDMVMKRRRHVELRRQHEYRRKKAVLFGRDIDGGEGGTEFVVPTHARLNDHSKLVVACGLRSAGVVTNVVQSGLMMALPEIEKRHAERAEENKKREGVRTMGFLMRQRRESSDQMYT